MTKLKQMFARTKAPSGDAGRLGGETRAIAGLAWPLSLAHLAGIALGTTDVVMMGWLGPEKLAAGSLAANFYALFYFFGLGVVMATAPMIAQALGARRLREVRRSVRQGLWAAVAMSLPATLAIWHTGAFLTAIGQPPEAAALGEAYVRAEVWGLMPSLGLMVLRNFVAAHDRPRAALAVIVLGIGVNALGNYALMFGNFGLPRLELVGAGIASAVVNGFMFLALLGYAVADRRFRRYRLLGRLWRPHWPGLREIFVVGTPIALMNLSEIGVFLASTFLVGLFGTTALAAHAIAMQSIGVAYMVPLGLGQAATIRVGRAVGGDDVAGAMRAGRVALALSALYGVASALVFWLGGEQIAGFFLDAGDPANRAAIDLAVAFLAVIALLQLADSPAIGALGALRGLKDTRVPMLIAAFGYWVIGAGAAIALAVWAGYGGLGVWWGLTLTLIAVSALIIARFVRSGPVLAAAQAEANRR